MGLLLVEAKKVTALALAKPASGAAGPGPSDRVVCDRPEVELIARLPWRQVVRRGAGTLSASEAATLAPGGRLFVVAAPRDVAALRSGARVLREDGDEVVLVIEPG